MPTPRRASPKHKADTGRPIINELSENATPTIDDYVAAVSDYVRSAGALSSGQSKAAQIALGSALGRALKIELLLRLPRMAPHAGELTVAGALRTARADVSEAHPLDGLRLAVEIKPVNLAVGRAIWNRFGDVRTFAVNIHLKFPFAVVGGVLAIPTWEWAKAPKSRTAAVEPLSEETSVAAGSIDTRVDAPIGETVDEAATSDADQSVIEDFASTGNPLVKRSTADLIDRLIRRLGRTRRRETEADAAHLLEAVCVIVYDPSEGKLSETIPPVGSGLRWDEFVATLVDQYDLRFED